MRVYIDAGHGGQDRGCNYKDLEEADYVLDMSHRLANLLAPYCDIQLSRTEDKFVSIPSRQKEATRFGANRVVSLHVNADLKGKLRGGSAFYLPRDAVSRMMATTYTLAQPDFLAKGNAKDLVEIDVKNQVHWTANARNVLKGYTCPAFLAEMFFMNDTSDRNYATSEEGRDAILKALFQAVTVDLSNA